MPGLKACVGAVLCTAVRAVGLHFLPDPFPGAPTMPHPLLGKDLHDGMPYLLESLPLCHCPIPCMLGSGPELPQMGQGEVHLKVLARHIA